MARIVRLVLLLFVVCSLFASFAKSDAVVLPPVVEDKTHESLLVLLIGAQIPPTDYTWLKQLQTSFPYRLWIAIPNFAFNTPDPVTADGDILAAIGQVQQQGFSNVSPKDVYLAGHSLGGIVARDSVNHLSLAGLILLGSYLEASGSNDYPHHPGPVLTLGGEVDGLTRITRIAVEYNKFMAYVASKGKQQALIDKPVVILPGVSHSQFCTVHVSGDLDPKFNISESAAHAAIVQAVSAFLLIRVLNADTSSPQVQKAIATLDSLSSTTATLVTGFLAMQKLEASSWCIGAQRTIVNVSKEAMSRLTVTEVDHSSQTDFASSKPSMKNSSNSAKIETELYNSFPLNPFDVSTIDVSADKTMCKMKSQIVVAEALNTNPLSSDPQCLEVNELAYQAALGVIIPEALKRYKTYGHQLRFGADQTYSTGITWLAAGVSFTKQSDGTVVVSSPSLETGPDAPFGLGGMHYCSLLSPARAMEWMLLDSLK